MNESRGDYWLEGGPEGTEIKSYPLSMANKVLFGRDRSCQIQLQDPQVSRHHAELRWQNGSFILEDLDSVNGTYVNGLPIRHISLTVGDRLTLGGSSFVLHGSVNEAEAIEAAKVRCGHCNRWVPSALMECPGCGAPIPSG